MKKLSALILGAALSAAAQAGTVSYSFNTANVLTDFGINEMRDTGVAPLTGSLNYFNRSLGTLTGVTLELTGTTLTDLDLVNTGGSKSKGDVSGKVQLYFTSSMLGLNSLLGGANSADVIVRTTTQNFSLNSGAHTSFHNLSSTGAESIDVDSIMSQFSKVGGGQFNISCSSLAGTTLSYNGGNAQASQTTTAGCGAIVTYEYTAAPPTPTPEPASLALVGLGMIGVAASRRKSRKA
ncbi:choice-of-anchor E domain-containing protein [Azohydromonas australica]|uniref:choice-of-anchor E domain-containing protein n=1 Tax=Azohydromonas australica TaxID=364039 RepID=UPI00041C346F|nr:choice-of-anchor E domain-containing protein [Azohydromonas australica]